MPAEATTAVVVVAGAGFSINVGGAVAPASWPAGYIPTAGDVVNVLQASGRLFVLGPVTTNPRPMSGTVAGAASSGLIPVTVTVGPSPILARYTGTAPAVGTLVFLDWQATTPRLWTGAVATVPPPVDPEDPEPSKPKPPPPPPPPPQTGSNAYSAVDSARYRPGYGRWDTGSVIQWRNGGESESRGAWFYGGGPTQLHGRTITRAQINLGPRLRIGSYNSGATAHLYICSNAYRPGGDTNRIAGPYDIGIPAGFGGGWADFPADWGQYLATNGGGLVIVGSPYMGFAGLDTHPASGQIALNWTR